MKDALDYLNDATTGAISGMQALKAYSKQQSIAFIEWAVNNHSVTYEGFGLPVYIIEDGEMKQLTTEQLYDKFLKETNQNTYP